MIFSHCKFVFKKNTKIKGFTLIELMVVIAVMGLLSSIIFASLSNARAKARDTRRKMDLEQLVRALALYINDNKGMLPLSNDCSSTRTVVNYPGTPNGGYGRMVTLCPPTSSTSFIGQVFKNNKYTSYFITDPRGGTTSGCRYYYFTDSSGKYYQFSAYLEKPTASDSATMTNGSPPLRDNGTLCNIGNYRITGSI